MRAAASLLAAGVLAASLGSCVSLKHRTAPPPSTTVAPPTTSTTQAGVQSSGPRTVLSPIGLHVRAQPQTTATILGTAAQGAVLTVLGHTVTTGIWYQVKGSTVTGWISGDPTLSAAGQFQSYSGTAFTALYPAAWKTTDSPPASVVFAPASGPQSIVATTAGTVAQLPKGSPGYGVTNVQSLAVCGVTSALVTYTRAAPAAPTTTTAAPGVSPQQYLVEIRLTLDPQHALGFYANLANLAEQLVTFRQLLASVTFSSPQCVG